MVHVCRCHVLISHMFSKKVTPLKTNEFVPLKGTIFNRVHTSEPTIENLRGCWLLSFRGKLTNDRRHSGDYKGTFTWEIAEGQVTPADEPGVLEV